MNQDRLQEVRAVGDAELVGDGDQQGVGLGDRFILAKLLHQGVRLGDIATPEDRPARLAEEADLVLVLAARAEIGAVQLRKDAGFWEWAKSGDRTSFGARRRREGRLSAVKIGGGDRVLSSFRP